MFFFRTLTVLSKKRPPSRPQIKGRARFFLFLFFIFINEVKVCVIFRKKAAANKKLQSGEVDQRWEDSDKQLTCSNAMILSA